MQLTIPHGNFVIERVQAEDALHPAVITLSLKDKPEYLAGCRLVGNGHYKRCCQRIVGHDVIFMLPRMRSGREESKTQTFSFLPDFLVPRKSWCLLDPALILFVIKTLGFKSLWSFPLPEALERSFERVMNCFIGAKRCGFDKVLLLLQMLIIPSPGLSDELFESAVALKGQEPLHPLQTQSYISLCITGPVEELLR